MRCRGEHTNIQPLWPQVSLKTWFIVIIHFYYPLPGIQLALFLWSPERAPTCSTHEHSNICFNLLVFTVHKGVLSWQAIAMILDYRLSDNIFFPCYRFISIDDNFCWKQAIIFVLEQRHVQCSYLTENCTFH